MATVAQDEQSPRSYELGLLGGLCLTRDATEVRLPALGCRLVSFVAVNGPSSRWRVCAALWPDSTEDRARADLRTSLWRVNKACPQLLASDGPRIGLAAGVQTDTGRLEAWAGTLRGGCPELGQDQAARALAGMADLLPGWTDTWVVLERERLRHVRLHALEALSARLLELGRLSAALWAARAAVDREPLRESGHRAVLGVLIAAGDLAAARGYAETTAARLRAELGVEPSAAFRSMASRARGDRPVETHSPR